MGFLGYICYDYVNPDIMFENWLRYQGNENKVECDRAI